MTLLKNDPSFLGREIAKILDLPDGTVEFTITYKAEHAPILTCLVVQNTSEEQEFAIADQFLEFKLVPKA